MKVSMVQARTFLKELFQSQKIAKRSKNNFINVSDKFTPEECKQILGDMSKDISSMARIWHTQFRAEIRDEATRSAILSMGGKSVYVDMRETSPQEMRCIVSDLIYDPHRF